MSGHPHAAHGEHHHHHHAPHRHGSGAALRTAAVLTVGFAVIEGLGGWWAGSLALVSDAGHMLTDGASLALAALAAWLARRPPSQRHSYGLGRAEIFAALVNAGAMLALAAALVYESIQRLQAPAAVHGEVAAGIALAGLVLNVVVLRGLGSHRHDMNTRAARLHVVGDLLGSVAALGAGLVVALTGWTRADPVASLLICALIGLSAVRLVRESFHALMEGVPHGLSVESIGTEMARVDGVVSVHDLHVWTLSGSRSALSAHVVVHSMARWDRTLAALQSRLHERFGIDHVTLQPEPQQRPVVFRK